MTILRLSTIYSGDLKEAERLVHLIKGIAGNLSAKELFETATELSKAIHVGYVENYLLQKFKQSFNTTIEGIKSL